MKKIISIIGILCLSAMAVFSALPTSPVSFDVKVEVPKMVEMKVSSVDASTVGAFNGITAITEIDLDLAETGVVSDEHYILVKTNVKEDVSLKTTVKSLKGDTTNSFLIFTLEGTGSDTTSITSTESGKINYFGVAGGNGTRVVSVPFQVSISSADISGANPDTYVSTITVEYTTL